MQCEWCPVSNSSHNNHSTMAALFPFNTLVVCYSCRRRKIATIKASSKNENQGKNNPNIIFISCGKCIELPHVFDPSTSLWRAYIDIRLYEDLISAFSERPIIFKERRFFSIVRLRFKRVAQIQDCRKVCELLEPAKFAAVGDGEGCDFFGKASAYATTRAAPIFRQQFVGVYSTSSLGLNPSSAVHSPPYSHETFSAYLKRKELPSLPTYSTSIT